MFVPCIASVPAFYNQKKAVCECVFTAYAFVGNAASGATGNGIDC